jgi:hypothetical protein
VISLTGISSILTLPALLKERDGLFSFISEEALWEVLA